MAEPENDQREERIGLHNLRPAPGSRRPRKRVGRGEGSGTGKTSGRGQKGWGSRSGAKRRPRFEGGQNPIHMRMRKLRGPHMRKSMPFEPFRTHTQPVNLIDLEARFESGAEVTLEAMHAKGLATRKGIPVKILATGELTKPLSVFAHGFSGAAQAKIEAAGGTCEVIVEAEGGGLPEVIATILGAFRVGDIRKKVLFTFGILALYRLGAYIPAPGINSSAVNAIQNNFGGSSILGFLNLFSGGGLGRIAIFALGIMPYITASIILQLLQVVVPSLEKLSKEGEVGQARITQYTRYLTVGLAFAQSIGYVFLFRSFEQQAGVSVISNFNLAKVFLIVVSLTAGTVLLMWMGELITQRGIGNGISLLIFASIVARIPHGVQAWWSNPDQVFRVIMPFIVLGVVAAIVFVQEGQRRIPIQYAKRVIGRRMTQGSQTYLPLRVNMAGVIPVIFAASLMAIPPTIGQLLGQNRTNNFATDVQNFFNPQGWHYVLGESLLIIVFTYFYTAVTFNPVDQAENLKKYGGFIPGVRPGRPTAEFLDRILARLTFPGALFLAAVAALPTILINQTSANFFFGGTSILIVIGVALDTMKQLEAQLMMRNYEGFLK